MRNKHSEREELISNRISTPTYESGLDYNKKGANYIRMFIEDMSADFAVRFSKSGEYREFFKIKSSDGKLEKLLNFIDYSFLSYKFSQLLSSNMRSLMLNGQCFIEIDQHFNKDNELKGILLHSFSSRFNLSINGKTTFWVKDYKGEHKIWTIPNERLIKLDLKDLNIERDYFQKIIKKLPECEIDYKVPSYIHSFEEEEKIKSLKMIKVVGRTYWSMRGLNNKYMTEFYLIYRIFQFNVFRKKFLDYFMEKYNKAINNVGRQHNFSGEIIFNCRHFGSSHDIAKLAIGNINCEKMGDLLFGKNNL